VLICVVVVQNPVSEWQWQLRKSQKDGGSELRQRGVLNYRPPSDGHDIIPCLKEVALLKNN
jgi:hypothetical protein